MNGNQKTRARVTGAVLMVGVTIVTLLVASPAAQAATTAADPGRHRTPIGPIVLVVAVAVGAWYYMRKRRTKK